MNNRRPSFSEHFHRNSRPLPGPVSLAAFTLVEVLVSVLIVAILLIILMPALNSARRSAYDAKCIYNMRQLGAALYTYAADNDGCLPSGIKNPPDQPYGWEGTILRMLEIKFKKNLFDIFVCPEAMRTYPAPPINTYVLNVTGAAADESLRIGQCSRPSKAILLAESAPKADEGEGYGVCSLGSVTRGVFEWRHRRDTMHVTFADGSVSTLSKSDTTDADLEEMLRNIRR